MQGQLLTDLAEPPAVVDRAGLDLLHHLLHRGEGSLGLAPVQEVERQQELRAVDVAVAALPEELPEHLERLGMLAGAGQRLGQQILGVDRARPQPKQRSGGVLGGRGIVAQVVDRHQHGEAEGILVGALLQQVVFMLLRRVLAAKGIPVRAKVALEPFVLPSPFDEQGQRLDIGAGRNAAAEIISPGHAGHREASPHCQDGLLDHFGMFVGGVGQGGEGLTQHQRCLALCVIHLHQRQVGFLVSRKTCLQVVVNLDRLVVLSPVIVELPSSHQCAQLPLGHSLGQF